MKSLGGANRVLGGRRPAGVGDEPVRGAVGGGRQRFRWEWGWICVGIVDWMVKLHSIVSELKDSGSSCIGQVCLCTTLNSASDVSTCQGAKQLADHLECNQNASVNALSNIIQHQSCQCTAAHS